MAFAGLAACGQGGGNTAEKMLPGIQGPINKRRRSRADFDVRAFAGGKEAEIWEKIAAAFEEANEGVVSS